MTAFQPIFDRASAITINKSRKASQTVSRDGNVRTTSIGGQTWEFEVAFPDNQPYAEMRGIIESLEYVGRTSTSTIQINNPGHAWINGYQGDLTNLSNISVGASAGNNFVTILSATDPLSPGQYKFRRGDYIQLGPTGYVYTVVEDVDDQAGTITLHRPLRDDSGSYTLNVGQAVSWNVVCVNLPQWTLNQRNLVSWDGNFVFAEVF